jgi:hypothetical protein
MTNTVNMCPSITIVFEREIFSYHVFKAVFNGTLHEIRCNCRLGLAAHSEPYNMRDRELWKLYWWANVERTPEGIEMRLQQLS